MRSFSPVHVYDDTYFFVEWEQCFKLMLIFDWFSVNRVCGVIELDYIGLFYCDHSNLKKKVFVITPCAWWHMVISVDKLMLLTRAYSGREYLQKNKN